MNICQNFVRYKKSGVFIWTNVSDLVGSKSRIPIWAGWMQPGGVSCVQKCKLRLAFSRTSSLPNTKMRRKRMGSFTTTGCPRRRNCWLNSRLGTFPIRKFMISLWRMLIWGISFLERKAYTVIFSQQYQWSRLRKSFGAIWSQKSYPSSN